MTIQVNSEGILHLLLDLKPNKAPGPDKTPACLLNELACELADWQYYKVILEQSCLPAEWKNTNVVPIINKNDQSCPQIITQFLSNKYLLQIA